MGVQGGVHHLHAGGPTLITQCTHYILVTRHLERVADNACKIAEQVVYMVTGKRRLNGVYKLPE